MLPELLGVEGDAASVYFRAFAGLLKPPEDKQGAGDLSPFRFRSAQSPATDRSGQRHVVARLCDAEPAFDGRAGLGRARSVSRLLITLRAMEGRRSRSTSWSRFAPSSPIPSCCRPSIRARSGRTTSSSRFTGAALTQAGRRRFVEAFERRLSQEVLKRDPATPVTRSASSFRCEVSRPLFPRD